MSKVMRKLSHLRETHEIQMSPVNIQEVVEEVTSGMVFPPDVKVDFENSVPDREIPAVNRGDDVTRVGRQQFLAVHGPDFECTGGARWQIPTR